MKFNTMLSTVIFLVLINVLQTTQAGLAAAVIVQRTIINQCILQAETGSASMSSLIKTYGQEAAPFLYIKDLKIFEVTVKFENQGDIVSYPCAEFFPELAPIHFYRGNWNEVLTNLEKEVMRLRNSDKHHYGKHLTLK